MSSVHTRDDRRILWLTAGAILLRMLLFLGRGDYVAFDEGWYLLLGRNVFGGDGYTLSGLQHTTLSPLFPLLAGMLDVVLRDPLWAGRVVAAFAAGLLVWPCWQIFRRLTDRRTAWLGCIFVAVMPALAPFVAAFWIGWDLWVGAEPLLHLFLFGGLALVLRARERRRALEWLGAGALFALAYLARAEALLAFGIMFAIVAALALHARRRALLLHTAAFGIAFALTAAPYWVYLHDATGSWTLTGRGIELPAPTRAPPPAARPPGTAPVGATATIEHMLWRGDESPYVRTLYALHPSGTRLASTYWGIPPAGAGEDDVPPAPLPAPVVTNASGEDRTGTMSDDAEQRVAPVDATRRRAAAAQPGRVTLYARALGRVVPWYLWPFAALGLLLPGRRWRAMLLVAAPVVGMSLGIAAVVAIDPRTQLFVAPLAAILAARGVRALGVGIDRRARRAGLRRGFVGALLAAVIVALLLGTTMRWLYLSTTLGSPHHLVGTANRALGDDLQRIVPPDATVMSWHPAIALYARRDWRVLPHASFDEIVRYANAIGTEYVVLSPYYPGPQLLAELPTEPLVVRIPPGAAERASWQLELSRGAGSYLFGELVNRD